MTAARAFQLAFTVDVSDRATILGGAEIYPMAEIDDGLPCRCGAERDCAECAPDLWSDDGVRREEDDHG